MIQLLFKEFKQDDEINTLKVDKQLEGGNSYTTHNSCSIIATIMMNPEYKIRTRKDYKLIKNDNKYTLTKYLKKEYPYIIQAMQYENYKIECEEYEIIQELLYENKVVGILTIESMDELLATLCINEVYILPEFRHKGIFLEAIISLLSQPNISITIRNPNRKIIDLLIKYKLAKKMKNNLVISYVSFFVDDSRIYTNKQIINQYEKKYVKNEIVPTDFYDLNINSCVFMEVNSLTDNKVNRAFIVKARKTDSKNEKYYELLKNVDNVYLENLKERIFYINEEELHFLQNVETNINNYLDINNIIGTEDKLTPIFEENLEKYNLSLEDGFNIRRKVFNALNDNEIIPKSMVTRTIYLLEKYSKEDEYLFANNFISDSTDEERCPYCHNTILSVYEVCNKCGHNLSSKHNDLESYFKSYIRKLLLEKLPPELTLKKKRNIYQNKINDILKCELNYLEYDENEVYEVQTIISTYQLLKDIDDIIYFEIYNYDLIHNIQEGSAFQFALKHNLLKELKDYQFYIKLMEDFYPDKFLKKILDEHNYVVTGQKDDLIERIKRNINPKEIFGDKYTLTTKGCDFLKDKDYLENYLENLSEFTFYEYKLFYEEHKERSFESINELFIKHMEDIALNTNNYYKYHNILRHKINSDDISQEEFIIMFTKLFIIDINYWIKSGLHRTKNKPLSKNVIQVYPEIIGLYIQYDLDEIFDKAFDSILLDDLKDNKDFVKFYLKKSMEYKDIEDINREIEYNIFKEEYFKKYSI